MPLDFSITTIVMSYYFDNLIISFWKILKEGHLKVEDMEEEQEEIQEEEVEEILKEKVMSSQSTIL